MRSTSPAWGYAIFPDGVLLVRSRDVACLVGSDWRGVEDQNHTACSSFRIAKGGSDRELRFSSSPLRSHQSRFLVFPGRNRAFVDQDETGKNAGSLGLMARIASSVDRK